VMPRFPQQALQDQLPRTDSAARAQTSPRRRVRSRRWERQARSMQPAPALLGQTSAPARFLKRGRCSPVSIAPGARRYLVQVTGESTSFAGEVMTKLPSNGCTTGGRPSKELSGVTWPGRFHMAAAPSCTRASARLSSGA
jgi:hypothetical protein